MGNPANMAKYQNNPKVMKLINQMMGKFGGEELLGACPVCLVWAVVCQEWVVECLEWVEWVDSQVWEECPVDSQEVPQRQLQLREEQNQLNHPHPRQTIWIKLPYRIRIEYYVIF